MAMDVSETGNDSSSSIIRGPTVTAHSEKWKRGTATNGIRMTVKIKSAEYNHISRATLNIPPKQVVHLSDSEQPTATAAGPEPKRHPER